ncbi:MAG: cation:proton antiporter [Lentisphaeria bacterium]|nr:cation:proton antiporter [Lentisphaeria bacterium]
MFKFPRLITLLVLSVLLTPLSLFASQAGQGASGASMTHSMMLLVIQLGLLLFATKLGNSLFERFKLPGVLGELCAGMVIGPFLLGKFPLPGFPQGLFPLAEGIGVSPELYGFCAVASIILLFMVGLETDIQQFLKYSIAGSAVGIGGVAASFVAGDLITVLFSRYLFGHTAGFMDPQCLFLGVVSTATSVGITARILTEKRKLDSPEGVTILAGAVVDDVLGIIMLTLVLGITAASRTSGVVDWGHIAVIGLKAVGIWLLATVAGLIFSRHISTMLKRFRGKSSIAVMALGLALILAGLFEQAGLAMIIGAYIMGLSLSRTDLAHVIQERLMPIYVFLVPIFFGVMGMLVDFSKLGNKNVLIFGLVYSLVAIVAKIIGSGGVALLFNFNLRGSARVGMGMVPRGEVALIVAGIGLAARALTPDVFGVAILMTIVTTVAAPPMLVKLFSGSASGLRKKTEEGRQESIRFAFPSATIARWVFRKLQDVFQGEGFFVHSLEHERGIVQVRRDVDVINMWPEAEDIVFSSKARELPLVKTAVMEVLAELKGTIQTLQEPVDVATVVGDLHVEEAITDKKTAPANFTRSLSQQIVCPSLNATDKPGILAEILDLLVSAGHVNDRETALKDLLRREESMSTGLQHGVAIPHAKTTAVDHLVCAVGLKPEGVEFAALDGEPSTIFVMTLSPEGAATPHIQFMSEISQVLTPECCDTLLGCRTARQMLAVLGGSKSTGVTPASEREEPGSESAARTSGSFRISDYLTSDLV